MDLLQPFKVYNKKFSPFYKFFSLSMLRRIIFVNKNAIKPDLGIFKAKIGKFYIGWERVWEFRVFFWDFIWPESSHTGSFTRRQASLWETRMHTLM